MNLKVNSGMIVVLVYLNGAGDLQGSAYDSGKQYGMSVITPLIKGAIMYSEYLSEAVSQNIDQKLAERILTQQC